MKRLFSCDDFKHASRPQALRQSQALLSQGFQLGDAPLRDLVLLNNATQASLHRVQEGSSSHHAGSARFPSPDQKHFKKKLASRALHGAKDEVHSQMHFLCASSQVAAHPESKGYSTTQAETMFMFGRQGGPLNRLSPSKRKAEGGRKDQASCKGPRKPLSTLSPVSPFSPAFCCCLDEVK